MASDKDKQLLATKKLEHIRQVEAAYQLLLGNTPEKRQNWNPLKLPIHYALLNGVRTPGIGSFPELESAQKWDIVTGPGLSGGAVVYRGAVLVTTDFVCRLYDKEDWEQLHVLLPVLENPTVGTRPQAILIVHPMLDLINPPVRAVVKPKWKLTEPDDYGVSTFTISMIQYRKLQSSQAKPEAAKPTPEKDYWDQLIDRQTGQIQELEKWPPQ